MGQFLSLDYFQKRGIIVEYDEVGTLRVFYTDQTPEEALEEVRFLLKRPFEPVKLSLEEFSDRMEALSEEEADSGEKKEGSEGSVLLELSAEAPVVGLINRILIRAFRIGASDVHFEPTERDVIVKFRLDGVLHEYRRIPLSFYPQVVSRIKIMANLNVAEKMVPQDGRMRIRVGERELDVRVSVLPTISGERIVLRLLEQSLKLLKLQELGLSEEDRKKVTLLAKRPYGLVFATGPTGAGKSTTLYAMLLLVRELYPHKNIITIEDPVEYRVSGIGQVQVNPKVGLTFAAGLRSILRQDPDVILVGEVRDSETADISVHAALTGHLVLSTLHTNDAPTAITRLADMGIEPYLIASSVEGIIAQRLVRTICPHCKVEYKPSSEELKALGLFPEENPVFFKGEGCEKCLYTGYKGRTGIFEVLILDEELKELILRTQNAEEIKKLAKEKGFKTLREDGLRKLLSGVTTASELISAISVEGI